MSAGRTALDQGLAKLRDVFGEEVTHVNTATDFTPVWFDEHWEVMSPIGGLEIGTTAPSMLVRDSDISLARRDSILISGVTYYVLHVEPAYGGISGASLAILSQTIPPTAS